MSKPKTQLTTRRVTPPQLAQRWGVGTVKVLEFIRDGELRAFNIASKRSSRPRFLIDPAEVERFERSREVYQADSQSQSQQPRLSRKPSSPPNEFFE